MTIINNIKFRVCKDEQSMVDCLIYDKSTDDYNRLSDLLKEETALLEVMINDYGMFSFGLIEEIETYILALERMERDFKSSVRRLRQVKTWFLQSQDNPKENKLENKNTASD